MRVIDAGAVRATLSLAVAARAVRGAFAAHVAGRTTTSQPPLMVLPLEDGDRLQAKAARVGDVVGIRLAGEHDGRHVDAGRRLVLYDAASLLPLAVVDERDLYRYRVGAQIAVAVERLRPADSRVLTVIGAGRLGRAAIEAIQALCPFERVQVHARRPATARAAVEALAASTPGDVVPATVLGPAVHASDVVVTLTTARTPFLDGALLSANTLVVSAGGGWECAAGVYHRADRLIVDDWEHCIQVGDLAPLSADGTVSAASVSATLPRVIAGDGSPRCGPDEIVVVVAQGMTMLDVALAAAVLDELPMPT